MNEKLFKNEVDEDNEIDSRRKFLKQIMYGSLLALSGSEIANATVRDTIHLGRFVHSQRVNRISQHIQSRHSKRERYAKAVHGHGHKTLSFEHAHTGDKLKLTYFEGGRYIKGALHEIDYLLRDYHTDDIHPIDTALLDQLFDLKQTLGINKPFHIVSGYRSPFTNSQLRKHSHGVAEHSFHMQGRAIDIRVEGVHAKTIKNAALTMARGGVGFYPHNDFVHLDTGEIRNW